MSSEKNAAVPTMNEVAREANVSVATVSRVVNGSGTVSKKLELQVLAAIEKLHYHPSSLARSFKMQQTQMIGIVVPLLDHPFFSRLAQVMEHGLFAQKYRVIICNTEEDPNRERQYIELLLQQRIDGIIIISEHADYFDEIEAQNIPMVVIDRTVGQFNCSQVFSDNSLGGYLGMKHLLELGHRRIQVVAPFFITQPVQKRIVGIREALAEWRIEESADMFTMSSDPSFEMGIAVGIELAQRHPRPTAIFALSDVTAVGVMHGVNRMNLRVPHDISVMGYDNIPLSAYVMPPLTTVSQSITEMGKAAVEILLRHIQTPELAPEKAVLPTYVVLRESVATPNPGP
ncbi:MAG: LacI family DNA-binding transcriptional regulator [Phototrophicaceae bacterium]|jgi:LacI family transcriptional regulator